MKPVQYSEEDKIKTLLENELETEPYELDDKELNVKRNKVAIAYLNSLEEKIEEPEAFANKLDLTEREKSYIVPFLYKNLKLYHEGIQKKQDDNQ